MCVCECACVCVCVQRADVAFASTAERLWPYRAAAPQWTWKNVWNVPVCLCGAALWRPPLPPLCAHSWTGPLIWDVYASCDVSGKCHRRVNLIRAEVAFSVALTHIADLVLRLLDSLHLWRVDHHAESSPLVLLKVLLVKSLKCTDFRELMGHFRESTWLLLLCLYAKHEASSITSH